MGIRLFPDANLQLAEMYALFGPGLGSQAWKAAHIHGKIFENEENKV